MLLLLFANQGLKSFIFSNTIKKRIIFGKRSIEIPIVSSTVKPHYSIISVPQVGINYS